jgi:prepilin-type N-terminal cleavage/methylation domain-containing protein
MKTKGFTLVEMILAIVIVGIIAGVSAKILLSGLNTYEFISDRKDITQNARIGMERIVDELILVKWWEIILPMKDETFNFTDEFGNITSFNMGTMGTITVLQRGTDFLAGPLSVLNFDYLKGDDSAAHQNWDVKKINVRFSIDSLRGHGGIALKTEVFPRNNMYDDFKRQ